MSLKFFLLLALCLLATVSAGGKAPAKCLLPQAPGMCRVFFPSFYFNKDTKKCEKFVYGGCQGNDNRFETKAECEKVCAQ